jgi:A/G-specific adenine glycosylase
VTTDAALISETRTRVLAWFAEAARDLPWRATRDPYRVLVAEVLAQQTQAARAAEAWPRFLGRFPDVGALAAAAPAEVLRAWQGLGYNRRALALRRTAQAVVERGGWPATVEELASLPGVGPYTARAVACFALGRRSPRSTPTSPGSWPAPWPGPTRPSSRRPPASAWPTGPWPQRSRGRGRRR